MRKYFGNKIVFALIFVISGLGTWIYVNFYLPSPETKEVNGSYIMETVLDLTDEIQFPHRNVSLEGNHEAALYIADKFEAYGLISHNEAPNYLQYYDGEKANVIGIIPGSDAALASETILIGGHFDTKAIFNDTEIIHEPGALDNASGTAVMMEIARVMADEKPRRTIIFVAFNEEEAGFVGSNWLAEHPLDGVDPIAMVNLDMVGSSRNLPIFVCTVGHGDSPYPIEDAFLACAEKLGFAVDTAAVGRTDHRSFAARGIPSVALYCYDNRYYHTNQDTPDKLSEQKLAEAGMLVIEWLTEAAN